MPLGPLEKLNTEASIAELERQKEILEKYHWYGYKTLKKAIEKVSDSIADLKRELKGE